MSHQQVGTIITIGDADEDMHRLCRLVQTTYSNEYVVSPLSNPKNSLPKPRLYWKIVVPQRNGIGNLRLGERAVRHFLRF